MDGVTRRTTQKERRDAVLELLGNHVRKADYGYLMTIDYVCYDLLPGAYVSSDDDLVQTLHFETIEDYCSWAEAA